MAVIAIDFGTAFSSVAARIGDNIEVFRDEHGSRRIPSVVSFLQNQIRIGSLAQLKSEEKQENTIYDIKRLLGQTYKKALELKDKYCWPFSLVEADKGNKVIIEVERLGKHERYYVEEIAAMILGHLVVIAEKHLKSAVQGAVLTVSSGFNHAQRKSILDAAHIAKISVKGLINEPTAAAVLRAEINLIKKTCEPLHTLVIHIGAGSFAINLSVLTGENVKVLQSYGNASIGGKDVENGLLQKLSSRRSNDEFRQKNATILRFAIQKIISKLNNKHEVDQVILLHDGSSRKVHVTKYDFDEASIDLRRQIEMVINNEILLEFERKIDEVILIGGSSRLSWVCELLSDKNLKNKTCQTRVITDEMAIRGAAVLSSKNSWGSQVEDILGYSIYEGDQLVLEKSSQFPTSTRKFSSLHPNKFQLTDDCQSIMLYSQQEIQSYELRIDENGMISYPSGQKLSFVDGLSENKIQELINRRENLLESYGVDNSAKKLKYDLETDTLNFLKEIEKVWVSSKCLADWIDCHPNSQSEELQVKREDFDRITHMLLRVRPIKETLEVWQRNLEASFAEGNSRWQDKRSELWLQIRNQEQEIRRLEHGMKETKSLLRKVTNENKALKERENEDQSDELKRKDEKIKNLCLEAESQKREFQKKLDEIEEKEVMICSLSNGKEKAEMKRKEEAQKAEKKLHEAKNQIADIRNENKKAKEELEEACKLLNEQVKELKEQLRRMTKENYSLKEEKKKKPKRKEDTTKKNGHEVKYARVFLSVGAIIAVFLMFLCFYGD